MDGRVTDLTDGECSLMPPSSPLSAPSPELLAVFQHRIIPQLSVRDLAALKCSCSVLRGAVEDLSVSQLRSLVGSWLVPLAPWLREANRQTIKRSFADYSAAVKGIVSGTYTHSEHMTGIARLSISPDGSLAAVLLQPRDPHPGYLAFKIKGLDTDRCYQHRFTLDSSCNAATYQPPTRGRWLKLTWSADSSQLFVLHTDSRNRVFTFHSICTGTGKTLSSVTNLGEWSQPSADGRYLAVSASPPFDSCKVLDLHEDNHVVLTSEKRLLYAWHPVKHSMLAVLETQPKQCSLIVRDVSSGQTIMPARLYPRQSGPICFSPNGQYLSIRFRAPDKQVPDAPSRVQLIDITCDSALLTVPTVQFEGGLFSPDSSRYVTESSYKAHAIDVWDLRQGVLLCSFKASSEYWPSCWSPDSAFLCFTRVSAAEMREHSSDAACIYEASTGKLLTSISQSTCPGSCVRAQWHPDCSRLIVHTSNCLYKSGYTVVVFGSELGSRYGKRQFCPAGSS